MFFTAKTTKTTKLIVFFGGLGGLSGETSMLSDLRPLSGTFRGPMYEQGTGGPGDRGKSQVGSKSS
jgi:hypothetical protein